MWLKGEQDQVSANITDDLINGEDRSRKPVSKQVLNKRTCGCHDASRSATPGRHRAPVAFTKGNLHPSQKFPTCKRTKQTSGAAHTTMLPIISMGHKERHLATYKQRGLRALSQRLSRLSHARSGLGSQVAPCTRQTELLQLRLQPLCAAI